MGYGFRGNVEGNLGIGIGSDCWGRGHENPPTRAKPFMLSVFGC